MAHTDTLGGLQQLAMLAVLALDDEAYGARIQEAIESRSGRSVSISTIYVTMERLESRGFVRSWLGDPSPVRGGRAKRLYALTADGLNGLREARRELDHMWEGLREHPAFDSL